MYFERITTILKVSDAHFLFNAPHSTSVTRTFTWLKYHECDTLQNSLGKSRSGKKLNIIVCNSTHLVMSMCGFALLWFCSHNKTHGQKFSFTFSHKDNERQKNNGVCVLLEKLEPSLQFQMFGSGFFRQAFERHRPLDFTKTDECLSKPFCKIRGKKTTHWLLLECGKLLVCT